MAIYYYYRIFAYAAKKCRGPGGRFNIYKDAIISEAFIYKKSIPTVCAERSDGLPDL
jgi:hypothetical protein